MNIWKFDTVSNDYTSFLEMPEQIDLEELFLTDGTPKHWHERPRCRPNVQKNKRKQMPLADLSYISPGSILLNRKAYDVLKDFILPFGQLLEVECMNEGGVLGEKESEIFYFYNVVNMVSCIDYENSQKIGSGVYKPAFFPAATPKDLQIFKDPLTKRAHIYLTEPAKEQFATLIADAGLVGSRFFQ